MNRDPIIYIDYVCSRCGRSLCATNYFIGTRQPCRHCQHENVVPRSSNFSQSHDSHSRDQQHDPLKPSPAKRDERYYASILELPAKVTRQEIKKAYKQQLLRYHPDRVQHLGREFQEIAHRKTQEITEAYDYFRRTYDL